MSNTLVNEFQKCAKDLGCHIEDLEFARAMDNKDPLRSLRNEFIFPKIQDLPGVELSLVDNPSDDCIYMSGNSLGLQPKGVKQYLETELQKWGKIGSHGYFAGEIPWTRCDEMVTGDLAKLVGAEKEEVVVMNGLSVNLHLLMVSFYRPTKQRHKILIEEHSFPSDLFAVESQLRWHGYDPQDSIIQIKAKPGQHILNTSDINTLLEEEGNSIALVLLGGIQYYTGQLFDIASITAAAHDKGCMVGFDLGHAVGNVPLHLHKWQVDFAVWCSYKYLNSGAGSLAGAFMHKKHASNDFPKFLGWWGHKKQTRFEMGSKMDLTPGIAGYRISNPSVMALLPIRASLDVFKQTSMEQLRKKSKSLTGYLEYLIQINFSKPPDYSVTNGHQHHPYIEVITPADPERRGSQLSLYFQVA
ncbi:kynureninase-like [Amphiura filiformis]|uniref:kynureninase-like n=1 Tax=Amphiura filiformis TaxID=82378 RepID=UPI003B21CF88